MRLPKATSLLTRLKRAALGFDAWVNASLYDSGRSTAEIYERFQQRMQVFSVRGWKRVALDLTSEGVTLGTGGAVLMLALAQPAFNLTSENWLKQQDLAVTFLDRYGVEVGRRGIKHDDSLKLDDFPDSMVRGGAASASDLTERERDICATIGPELRRRGLILVGIDVIDGNLTEINVTSPTGIRAIKRLGGPDLAVSVWDAIEGRLSVSV